MKKIAKCPSCGSVKIKPVRRKWSGEYRGQTYTVETSEILTNVPTAKSKSMTPRPCGSSRPTRPLLQEPSRVEV